MSIKSKAFGVLFVILSGICFAVNVHILNPWLIGNVIWLWNPPILFAPNLISAIPQIPFINGYVGKAVVYLLAFLWSVILLGIGIAGLKHKSKKKNPFQSIPDYVPN